MRIEWLNADCTEALVTRGWLRKRQAHVRWFVELTGGSWRFLPSRNAVPKDSWLEICLDSERRSRTAPPKTPKPPKPPSDWTPPRALPPARVVERKS